VTSRAPWVAWLDDCTSPERCIASRSDHHPPRSFGKAVPGEEFSLSLCAAEGQILPLFYQRYHVAGCCTPLRYTYHHYMQYHNVRRDIMSDSKFSPVQNCQPQAFESAGTQVKTQATQVKTGLAISCNKIHRSSKIHMSSCKLRLPSLSLQFNLYGILLERMPRRRRTRRWSATVSSQTPSGW
jgi:hypothetical protein